MSTNKTFFSRGPCSFSSSTHVPFVMNHIQFSLNFQTVGLTFSSNTLWHDAEFIVDSMTVNCPGPKAAKQPKSITFPLPCFTAGIMFFSHNAFFVFAKPIYCYRSQRILYLINQSICRHHLNEDQMFACLNMLSKCTICIWYTWWEL